MAWLRNRPASLRPRASAMEEPDSVNVDSVSSFSSFKAFHEPRLLRTIAEPTKVTPQAPTVGVGVVGWWQKGKPVLPANIT